MNKVSRGIFIICLLSYIPLGWGADNYFSCNTSKGDISLKTDDHKLIYEMKKNKGDAFSFSSPAPEYKGFLYNHYSRFQTDYLNVSFEQGGFKYSIFSNYEDGDSTRGVTVTKLKNNKEYVYNCKDDGVDKLAQLVSKLQCDKDSSLGC